MEFRVPQYIEVEDKLFGPFTLMQFIYLVGGGGVVFLLWAYLPSFLAIIFIIPVAAFTWALVFFPKHKYGKSFTDIAEAAIGYFSRPRLYTWRKEQNRRSTGEISVKKSAGSVLGLP
ncbi:MAG: hypothetical protein GWM98_24800, partial [Nitrospinaceae bacterium]|nr:hypothetical protein [Nitrospinaceae bacterium]